MTHDDTTHAGQLTPINASVRLAHGEGHSDEVKARCFVLYCTMAARNCADVEILYREEVGPDEPIPTRQVISTWARQDAWAEQADDIWRNTKGWTHEQLRVIYASSALLAAHRRHEILIGKGLDGVPNDIKASLQLKAGELSDRAVERIFPLGRMQPGEKSTEDTKEMTRDEAESAARRRIVARSKESA